jgi:hypothetical protein
MNLNLNKILTEAGIEFEVATTVGSRWNNEPWRESRPVPCRPVIVLTPKPQEEPQFEIWISRDDPRDDESWSRWTLAEAKADLAGIELWPGDSAGVWDCEAGVEVERRNVPPLTEKEKEELLLWQRQEDVAWCPGWGQIEKDLARAKEAALAQVL